MDNFWGSFAVHFSAFLLGQGMELEDFFFFFFFLGGGSEITRLYPSSRCGDLFGRCKQLNEGLEGV